MTSTTKYLLITHWETSDLEHIRYNTARSWQYINTKIYFDLETSDLEQTHISTSLGAKDTNQSLRGIGALVSVQLTTYWSIAELLLKVSQRIAAILHFQNIYFQEFMPINWCHLKCLPIYWHHLKFLLIYWCHLETWLEIVAVIQRGNCETMKESPKPEKQCWRCWWWWCLWWWWCWWWWWVWWWWASPQLQRSLRGWTEWEQLCLQLSHHLSFSSKTK